MLIPSSRVRVYVYRRACDMRKSFSGLSGLVRSEVGKDPLSGHLFVFLNRRRTYVKVLYWDVDGYSIWSKQLTKGTFELPCREELSVSSLYPLLNGYGATKKRRYQHIPE